MVLPVQNSEFNAPSTQEGSYVPEIAQSESSPTTPEGIPAPSFSDKPIEEMIPNQPVQEKSGEDSPQPGKIVDKATKHKERISTLATFDEITKKADEKENEFIPLVEEAHDTAHEHHT